MAMLDRYKLSCLKSSLLSTPLRKKYMPSSPASAKYTWPAMTLAASTSSRTSLQVLRNVRINGQNINLFYRHKNWWDWTSLCAKLRRALSQSHASFHGIVSWCYRLPSSRAWTQAHASVVGRWYTFHYHWEGLRNMGRHLNYSQER